MQKIQNNSIQVENASMNQQSYFPTTRSMTKLSMMSDDDDVHIKWAFILRSHIWIYLNISFHFSIKLNKSCTWCAHHMKEDEWKKKWQLVEIKGMFKKI